MECCFPSFVVCGHCMASPARWDILPVTMTKGKSVWLKVELDACSNLYKRIRLSYHILIESLPSVSGHYCSPAGSPVCSNGGNVRAWSSPGCQTSQMQMFCCLNVLLIIQLTYCKCYTIILQICRQLWLNRSN